MYTVYTCKEPACVNRSDIDRIDKRSTLFLFLELLIHDSTMTSPNFSTGSFDSLFDEDEESDSSSKGPCGVRQVESGINASRTTPPIPGLYIFPELLGSDISRE